jgi:hypothetical protein
VCSQTHSLSIVKRVAVAFQSIFPKNVIGAIQAQESLGTLARPPATL